MVATVIIKLITHLLQTRLNWLSS